MQEDPTSPSLPTPRVSVYCAREGREHQQDAWLARALPGDIDDADFLRSWFTKLGDAIHLDPTHAAKLAHGGATFNAAICRLLPDGQFRITAANIGDSMTILLTRSRGGTWEARAVTKQHSFLPRDSRLLSDNHMTSEHKEVEERIRALNRYNRPELRTDHEGYMALVTQEGEYINTGRSIGDTLYDGNPEDPVMSHKPDIETLTVNPDEYEQVYVITATDGLWDESRPAMAETDDILVALQGLLARSEQRNTDETTGRPDLTRASLLAQLAGSSNTDADDQDNTAILVATPPDCEEGAVLLAVIDGHGEAELTPGQMSPDLGIDLLARQLLDAKLTGINLDDNPTPPASTAADGNGARITPSLTVSLSGDTEATTVEYVDPSAQAVHEDGDERQAQLREQHEQCVQQFTAAATSLTSKTTLTDAQLTAHLQTAMGRISPLYATDPDGYCEDVWTRFTDAYWAEHEARSAEEACCHIGCLSTVLSWSCSLFSSCRRDADPVMQALETEKNAVVARWKSAMGRASMGVATLEVAGAEGEEVKLGN